MRLIDADALEDEMYHKSFEVDDGRNVWNSGLWIRYKIFEEAIRDAPTVDAVPIIRCKDCMYFRKYADGRYDCDNLYGIADAHKGCFCIRAERRKENG